MHARARCLRPRSISRTVERRRDIFITRQELFPERYQEQEGKRDRRGDCPLDVCSSSARVCARHFLPLLLLYPILFLFPARARQPALVPARTNNVMRAAVALPRVTFFRKQTALLSPRSTPSAARGRKSWFSSRLNIRWRNMHRYGPLADRKCSPLPCSEIKEAVLGRGGGRKGKKERTDGDRVSPMKSRMWNFICATVLLARFISRVMPAVRHFSVPLDRRGAFHENRNSLICDLSAARGFSLHVCA